MSSLKRQVYAMAMMAAAMSFEGESPLMKDGLGSPRYKVAPENWKKEYLLIKEKKSHLSKSEREFVVRKIESLIKKRKLTEDLKPIY